MKRIPFLFLLFIAVNSFSQTYEPGKFNKQIDLTGAAGMLSLVADKYIMELNENNMITLRINWVNPGDDIVVPQQYDYNFEDPSKAPWKISKWEILEGGGELKEGPGHYYASYVSPKTMPANKLVTIALTLEPLIAGYPKTQLLQTIYLQDNDNVFYYDCPKYGVYKEKYVMNTTNGILQTTNLTQANNNANAQQKAQLAELQKKLEETNRLATEAAASKGYDVSGLTSNAKAIYAKEKDITTIQIMGKDVQMENGTASNKKRNYIIVLSFPGQATGKFKIKSDPKITTSILLVGTQQMCACAFDPKDDPKRNPPCAGGTIYISKYDTKAGYVEGEVYANLQGAVGKEVIFGNLHGKFRVKLANLH